MSPSRIWPSVKTGGQLEAAEREWLHTNSAGAYSMSTVALMHTRRFHGLLVAALEPPLSRHVIVSHAETVITAGSRQYRLSTHQFPDIAPTPGYRLLEEFHQDPLPRWRYRLGKGEFERRLCLVRGENCLVVEYCYYGKSPVELSLKPLLPLRPIHELRSEDGGLVQRVKMRPGEVRMQPERKLPTVVFGHPQVFVGSPDWWRRFEYSEDRRREAHFQEDLWTPGTFEMTLNPGEPRYLMVGVDELPEGEPQELMAETNAYLLSLDPGTSHSHSVRSLLVAAEQFRAEKCPRPSVISGYPWLGAYTRDTLISIPGLFLTCGRHEQAKEVIRTLLAQRRDGLLVLSLAEQESEPSGVSVDSSLWLFEAVHQIAKHLPKRDTFLEDEMFVVLKEMFYALTDAQSPYARLTPDGLFSVLPVDIPVTWMDAQAHGEKVTPRSGIAIEQQALWYRACRLLSELAGAVGDIDMASQASDRAELLERSFSRYFFPPGRDFPFDCLDACPPHVGDPAVRPNAVMALAIAPELFSEQEAAYVVKQTRESLLTPSGLRTLDPASPDYVGYYEGGMEARRAAYHQGAVWVYLLGAYTRAVVHLFPDDFEIQMDLKGLLTRAMQTGPVLGQVGQVTSGDAPHHPGGCPAQAWSVAELLRGFVEQLRL